MGGMKQPKRLGIGATVSFQCKFIHPHHRRDAKFPSLNKGQRLTNARVVRRALKKIKDQPTVCVVVHHRDFKDEDGSSQDIYCNEIHIKVEKEGPPKMFFEDENEGDKNLAMSTTSLQL